MKIFKKNYTGLEELVDRFQKTYIEVINKLKYIPTKKQGIH